MRKSWDHFYQLTKDNPPSIGLVKTVSLLGHAGDALDFGCGAGRDTRYLLAQGFHVTAVDQEAVSLALLTQLQTERLCFVQSTFEDFPFAHYDLVNAHFTLPFIRKELFSAVFTRLKTSLKPCGIFVGQFFGVHDTWNVSANHMTFFTREQALDELKGLDIATFDEEEVDGITADGTTKHWHVYHIIAYNL
ncbi:tellurite resistance protein [Ktedonobacteria bacterium brp13]|nr:tellurite resistance protein [Ktedonobacteria bacterium brp13]